MVRKIVTAVAVLLALLFWYMTLTVPMVSAAAPAILAIAFSGVAYFSWPRKKKPEGSRSVF